MTRTLRRLGRPLLVVITLSTTGCSHLFTEPPRPLFRITAPSGMPTSLPQAPVQLVIDTPDAPAALNTERIAISRSPVSLDYLADGDWTDRAPALVRSALIEGFESSKSVNGVGRDSFALRADFALEGELRHFEAVYDSPDGKAGTPVVWVALAVKLVKIPEHTIVAETVITARESAAANATPQIVMAFNAALSNVVAQTVRWMGTNPALSIRRR
jgi:cholesterol transport system auxiliary component